MEWRTTAEQSILAAALKGLLLQALLACGSERPSLLIGTMLRAQLVGCANTQVVRLGLECGIALPCVYLLP